MRGAGPDLVSAGPSSRRFAGGPTQQWRARCVGGARSNGGTGRPRPAAWEWLHRVKAWPVLTGRRRRRLWASLSSLEASSGIFTPLLPDQVLRVKAQILLQGRAVSSSSTPFPSLGRRLEEFDPFGASYDWTCTVASVATTTVVSNVGGAALVVVVGSSSPACPWECLDCPVP
uniref:Uncharacterized protein n=1 Tax=Aegilops tauschii subsp. strangulata TaxID=200361 RepID=A0A453EYH1_AEGTS